MSDTLSHELLGIFDTMSADILIGMGVVMVGVVAWMLVTSWERQAMTDDAFSLELLRVFVQSNRPLWTVCDDCLNDVPPQIDMTPDGPRTVVGMCACGFLTPGALVVEVSTQPAKEAAGESEAAA